MIPRELKLDANGQGRIDRIEEADRAIALARLMAAAYASDPDRGFEEFGDDECEACLSRKECGLRLYLARLQDAVELYRTAGLGLLAHRARVICRSDPAKAWIKFDKRNAATEVF